MSTLAVILAAAVGGAAVLAGSVRLAGLEASPRGLELTVALQTVAIVALLAAAALSVSRWRVDGRAPSAYLALGLVVYALGVIPVGGMLASMAPQPAAAVQDEAVCLAVTVVVSWLALAALRDHDLSVPSPRHIALRATLMLAVPSTAVVVLDRVIVASDGRVGLGNLQVGMDLTAGALWLGLAGVGWRHHRQSPWVLPGAAVATGFALVRVLDAMSSDVTGSPAHLAATLLGACLAVLVGWCTMCALAESIDTANRLAEATARERDEAADKVLARDAWREELNHDAINAITGLRAAISLMAHYDEHLDDATARRLLEAALQEVAHLEHLVVRSADEELVVLDVKHVVSSVVETRRADGLVIDVDEAATGPEVTPGESLALGRAGDVATVLHNLLINVRCHAPGSRVRLGVTRSPDHIGVSVRDDGPGIDKLDRARMFARGVRGPASRGSGLGLFVARELMREQGGDLVLVPSVTGCHFLATLPAACTPQSPVRASISPRAPMPVPTLAATRPTAVDA